MKYLILSCEILSLKESYENLCSLNLVPVHIVIIYQLILIWSWFLEIWIANNTTIGDEQSRGCPSIYNWWHTAPLLPLPQFFVVATLAGISYRVGQVIHNVLYSQILGLLTQIKSLDKEFVIILVSVTIFFFTGCYCVATLSNI